jgi:thiamine-monophosphate kinase
MRPINLIRRRSYAIMGPMAVKRQEGEDALIASFARFIDRAGVKPRGLVAGVGDDAAIFRGSGEDYVVTKDVLVEGRHFRRTWFSGAALGWRAAAVNLSDVAAMGAHPRFGLVSLVVPENMPLPYARGIERGIQRHLAKYGATIIGGNVSGVLGPLVVDVTLIGACRSGAAWKRNARRGDAIVLVGPVGDAAIGLSQLEENPIARGSLVTRYRKPVPRLDVARLLAGHPAVHGAMDISDGLSTDLIRMCRASGVGCELAESQLPLSRALKAYCIGRGHDPLMWAMRGGEDYALILAVAPSKAEWLCRRVKARLGISAVVAGHFTGKKGQFRIVGEDGRARAFRASGWDHLKKG